MGKFFYDVDRIVQDFADNYCTPENPKGYKFIVLEGGKRKVREDLARKIEMSVGDNAFVYPDRDGLCLDNAFVVDVNKYLWLC